jgi:hypothetical protein
VTPVVTSPAPTYLAPVSQLTRRIAGYGLSPGKHGSQGGHGDPARGFPAEPLGGADWNALLARVTSQRIVGLLAWAVADGILPTTDDQAEEVHRAHVDAMGADLVRDRQLIDLVRLLGNAGLDHRALKGTAVAHLDYPDPALRSFVDVDLLVRAEEWDDAVTVITSAGWERRFLEPRRGFDRRFVKGTILFRPDDGRVELDLHRTLALGPFGLTVRLGDLWEGCDRLRLGGVELRALQAEPRYLHACFHAVLGDVPPRLVPLRDLAQMSAAGQVDFDRVVDLARSWQAGSVLRHAIQLAWDILGLDPSAEAPTRVKSLQPAAREARALDAYTSPRRSYVGLCLATVAAIRGPGDKVRYLTALAFPARHFVAPRYRSPAARWQAAARALRAGRGGRRSRG